MELSSLAPDSQRVTTPYRKAPSTVPNHNYIHNAPKLFVQPVKHTRYPPAQIIRGSPWPVSVGVEHSPGMWEVGGSILGRVK